MTTRQLSPFETASFLARHPVIATRVAQTRMAMAIGLYDFNYYDHIDMMRKFPGIIEPIGLQVEDSQYGLVTVQPAPGGMFFTGWSPVIGDAEKPKYEALPFERNWLDDVKDVGIFLIIAGAVAYGVTKRISK